MAKVKIFQDYCSANGYFKAGSILEFPDKVAKHLVDSMQGELVIEVKEKELDEPKAPNKLGLQVETADLKLNKEEAKIPLMNKNDEA